MRDGYEIKCVFWLYCSLSRWYLR